MMVDKELLEAIGQMMEAQEKRLSDMVDAKLKPITERLDSIEQRFLQQRKEIMQDVKTLLDSEFTPRFNLLAENQDEILRRVPTEEDEELWNTRLAALEAMVKKHSREIAALRKAN